MATDSDLDAHARWRRTVSRSAPPAADLRRLPLVGRLLRWRHARTLFALPLVVLTVAIIAAGITGIPSDDRNLATRLTWVYYRGAVVLAFLLAGNLFCLGCPFMPLRELVRRIAHPRRHWPRRLRSKWLAVVLFALFLVAYQVFELWRSPAGTAVLVGAYVVGAAGVDAAFSQAPFCKYVCPVGQFNVIASTISPTELTLRDPETCITCRTVDCLKGTRAAERHGSVTRRGCELSIFLPQKVGNLDCTLCLDCVQACPNDNVALALRMPGRELLSDAPRSGIGTLSKRTDLAALIYVFAFGALFAALGSTRAMVVPGTWPLVAAAFLLGPPLLVGGAAWATRALAASRASIPTIATRFAVVLVPVGAGIWLAHDATAFLDGIGRGAIASAVGAALATAGLAGTIVVARHVAARGHGGRARWALMPWVLVGVALWAAGAWVRTLPRV